MKHFAANGLACLLVGVVATGCAQQRARWNMTQMSISIDSEPQGAMVYQEWAVNQQRVLIGTTPIENLPVMVISNLKVKGGAPFDAQRAYTELCRADVTLEKEGYQPMRALLAAGALGKPVAHKLTLQPKPAE